jgi:hypothetical protein
MMVQRVLTLSCRLGLMSARSSSSMQALAQQSFEQALINAVSPA